MMIRCPVCKDRHSVPDNYDNKEFVCTRGKTFVHMENTKIMETSMLNTASTKINENRAATIIIDKPDFRNNGEPIRRVKPRNW